MATRSAVTQFNFNDDIPREQLNAPPPAFPPAVIDACELITTRVLMENGEMVVTQNVLVPRPRVVAYHEIDTIGNNRHTTRNYEDYETSSSSSSDDSMSNDFKDNLEQEPEQAYLILPEQIIRGAMFGQVVEGFVLKRRNPQGQTSPCYWEKTMQRCAIKEMSWEKIRQEQDNLAEDPRKEMDTMCFLKNHFDEIGYTWNDVHLMCPLAILQNDRYLYCIMPLMERGDLFDVLDLKKRFSEDECRYWMDQLLIGVEQMQNVEVCHRDMSLENIMVDANGRAIIIDWGMCLRIPYSQESSTIEKMAGMTMGPAQSQQPQLEFETQRQRYLIHKRERCGKWFYMSPEVYKSILEEESPNYDGHAVDLWACGVMLFSMSTGYPPWSRPDLTDEKFKYMTDGYLIQIVDRWQMGLSRDLLDLLERMLFRDPRQRLSLAQVRAHPWMVNGTRRYPF